MNKLKKSLLVLAGLAVLAAGGASVFFWGSEPRFEGKSLNHWLKIYNTPFQASNAVPALKAMGSTAVPILAEQIVQDDSQIRKLYESCWYKIPVIFRSFLPAPGLPHHRAMLAARALGGIGPAAAVALPSLSLALSQPEARIRRTAAFAIGQIAVGASNTVRLLAFALRDRDTQVRDIASDAIAKLGSEAAPFLVVEAQSTNRLTRLTAIQTISKLDIQSAEWRGLLVQRLQDNDGEVRRMATLALAGMGGLPAKRLRTPTPEQMNFLLGQADSNVCRIALGTLRSAPRPLDESVIAKVIALTAIKDISLRSDAFRTLGFCGGTSEVAIRFLNDQIDSPDPNLRASAIWAIGEIGPPAERLLTRIQKIKTLAEFPEETSDPIIRAIDYAVKRLTIEGYPSMWGP